MGLAYNLQRYATAAITARKYREVSCISVLHRRDVETIFIERACLYALVLETGKYGPSEIDKAIDYAKENPAYQTAARTQFAEVWKTLDEMGKAALLELQLQIPSTGKPN